MASFTPYWKWDNAVSSELIDLFLEEVETQPYTQAGTIVDTLAQQQTDLKVRNTGVILTQGDHWFAGILFNYAAHANSRFCAGWEKSIIMPQTLQLAKYSVDQHYDWHMDSDPLNADPIVRKLSAVCLLSNPGEFEGGQFEFKKCLPPELKKGSILIFPSELEHRVAPVVGGIRRSATTWIMGQASR